MNFEALFAHTGLCNLTVVSKLRIFTLALVKPFPSLHLFQFFLSFVPPSQPRQCLIPLENLSNARPPSVGELASHSRSKRSKFRRLEPMKSGSTSFTQARKVAAESSRSSLEIYYISTGICHTDEYTRSGKDPEVAIIAYRYLSRR